MTEFLQGMEFQRSASFVFKGVDVEFENLTVRVLRCSVNGVVCNIALENIFHGSSDLTKTAAAMEDGLAFTRRCLASFNPDRLLDVNVRYEKYRLGNFFSPMHSAVQFASLSVLLAKMKA